WHGKYNAALSSVVGKSGEAFVLMNEWLANPEPTPDETFEVWGRVPEPGKDFGVPDLLEWVKTKSTEKRGKKPKKSKADSEEEEEEVPRKHRRQNKHYQINHLNR
ncbi:hypothetical protein BDN72DRAFT_866194, partial [Pluteus cervinus]